MEVNMQVIQPDYETNISSECFFNAMINIRCNDNVVGGGRPFQPLIDHSTGVFTAPNEIEAKLYSELKLPMIVEQPQSSFAVAKQIVYNWVSKIRDYFTVEVDSFGLDFHWKTVLENADAKRIISN